MKKRVVYGATRKMFYSYIRRKLWPGTCLTCPSIIVLKKNRCSSHFNPIDRRATKEKTFRKNVGSIKTTLIVVSELPLMYTYKNNVLNLNHNTLRPYPIHTYYFACEF